MKIIMRNDRKFEKKQSRIRHYIIAILIIIVIMFAVQSIGFKNVLERKSYGIPSQEPTLVRHFYHAHADFKVFIEGKEISFNKSSFDVANQYIHLHLNNPNGDKVIHVEGMENLTLGTFFESLGMKFNASCFVLDTGESYCSTLQKRIRFFVNGNENFQFDFYEPLNLNRILITYGNDGEEEIMQQMANVTDLACIYSNKCPERIAELPVPKEKLIF